MLPSSQRSWLQQSFKNCLIPGLTSGPTPAHWPYLSRIWSSTNAHTDLWLGVLSCLQLEPVACLSSALSIDFLDDQWSHFSPSPDDLYAIYGLEIKKINLWHSLREHVHEQLGAGRMLILEVPKSWMKDINLIGKKDYLSSRHLPIAMNDLDETQGTCGYFYGQTYLHLEGEAYRHFLHDLSDNVFNSFPAPLTQAHVVSVRGWVHRPQHTWAQRSWLLLEQALEQIPEHSPVERWQHRYARDAALYAGAEPARFEAWIAANVQPFGAAFELASWYLLWAASVGRGSAQHMVQAADTFRQLSVLAKALQLKSERAYQLGQSLDATDLLERMARHWQKGMDLLRHALEPHGLHSKPLATAPSSAH